LSRFIAIGLVFVLSPGGLFAADVARWTRAIQKNAVSDIRALLTDQPDLDQPASDGKTALMAAAAAGDAALLEKLLQAGADPQRLNHKLASALVYAAWGGSPAVVRLLLAHQIDIDQRATNGWTALTMAAAKGHDQVVRMLILKGATVDVRDVHGWTPLMRAVDRRRDEAVRVLVEAGGAAPEVVNMRGQTALHIAAAAGNRSTYELLIALGCNPQQRDFNGETPSNIAEKNGLTTP
jgi:ankyrin repeat protein